MARLKPIVFCGNSLSDLKEFPEEARREAGHPLDTVQQCGEPSDWKPMPSVGSGVREIRLQDSQGIFRVFYVAKFEDCIFVLHCFQKKTQKTSAADLNVGRRRYKELLRERTS